MKEKMPISALVASCNEGHLLEDCLKSLQFCDEIYFVNLGSTDNSVEIAKRHATTIEEFERVPRIEDLHPVYIPKLKYDWFILIDPDERIRPELAEDIQKYIQNPQPYKSLIRVYLWYYFKGKKLKGGPYQKAIRGRLLFYRPGINVSDEVHTGITAKAGYGIAEIPFTGENYDEHYWCNSWSQLKDKHSRYAKGEGKVLYLKGKRFGILPMIYFTVKKFFDALFTQQYYKDRITGLRFSSYEARYTFLSWMSLKNYQKERKSIGELKSRIEVAKELLGEKVETFIATTEEVKDTYSSANNATMQDQILEQYQKSLHRIVNDVLELNEFELAKKTIQAASFNNEMKDYICNILLLGRFKLIQNSGSYKLGKKFAKVSIKL